MRACKSRQLKRASLLLSAEVNDKQFCRAPRVAVLVSAQTDRYLQLFWDLEYIQEGDWIGLFQEDPQTGKEVFPIYTVVVQNTTGLSITNVTSENGTVEEVSAAQFTPTCLRFWIGYFTKSGTGLWKFDNRIR